MCTLRQFWDCFGVDLGVIWGAIWRYFGKNWGEIGRFSLGGVLGGLLGGLLGGILTSFGGPKVLPDGLKWLQMTPKWLPNSSQMQPGGPQRLQVATKCLPTGPRWLRMVVFASKLFLLYLHAAKFRQDHLQATSGTKRVSWSWSIGICLKPNGNMMTCCNQGEPLNKSS